MHRLITNILVISTLFAFVPMGATAMEARNSIYDQKFYFYKVEGQKLKRGQDYASYDFPEIRNVYPDFEVNSLLPKNYTVTPERMIGFTLSFPVKNPNGRYRFQIEQLRLRSDNKRYVLLHPFERSNITPSHPSYNWFSTFEVNEGVARMKHSFDVDHTQGQMISFGTVENNPPEKLYLDYRIRIQQIGEAEHVFEGTISMERKRYVPEPYLLKTAAYWQEKEKARKEGKHAQ